MIDPIKRCLMTQQYVLTGDELRTWRLSQPGEHIRRRQPTKGWTQAQVAAWAGVSELTVRAWEQSRWPDGKPARVPEWFVRRIVEYSASLDAKLDAMLW